MYYANAGKPAPEVVATSPALIPHADLRRPRHDFIVVTSVFNPRGFKRRYDLYRQFEQYVAASGAQLMTVEVALGDRPWASYLPRLALERAVADGLGVVAQGVVPECWHQSCPPDQPANQVHSLG